MIIDHKDNTNNPDDDAIPDNDATSCKLTRTNKHQGNHHAKAKAAMDNAKTTTTPNANNKEADDDMCTGANNLDKFNKGSIDIAAKDGIAREATKTKDAAATITLRPRPSRTTTE